MQFPLRSRPTVVVLAIAASCGGETQPAPVVPTPTPVVETPQPPVMLAVSDTVRASVTAATLPVQVRILTAKGAPYIGQAVTFSVISGGGRAAEIGNTDDKGVAS